MWPACTVVSKHEKKKANLFMQKKKYTQGPLFIWHLSLHVYKELLLQGWKCCVLRNTAFLGCRTVGAETKTDANALAS